MNTGNLEVNQRLQDRMIAAFGNLSASNDPTQIPNDANDVLKKGAAAFALGRNRGLSDEQSMTAVEVGIEMGMTPEQAIREVSRTQRAQVRAALGASVEVDPAAQLKQAAAQLGTVPAVNERPAIVLEDLNPDDAEQNFRQGDREYKSPEQLDNMAEREDFKDDIAAERRGRYERAREAQGLRVFKNQPTSLTRVYGADDREFGSDRIEPVRTMTGAEQEAERGAMTELSKELRRREDARISNPEVEAANIFKAQAEARAFLRANLTAGEVRVPNSSEYTTAEVYNGEYVDPRSGTPVPTYEPQTDVFAGVNTPDSAQKLNAPYTESAKDFVSRQTDTGSTFTADKKMPNVDIGTTLGNLDDSIAKLGQSRNYRGLATQGPIRTVDSFQKAVDAIVAMSNARGIPMQSFDEQGKMTKRPVGQRGIAEVMNTLEISPGEAEKIAIALTQLESAGRTQPISMPKDAVRLERPLQAGILNQGGKMEESEVPLKRGRSRFKTSGREQDPELLSLARSKVIGVERGAETPSVSRFFAQDSDEDAVTRKKAEMLAEDSFGMKKQGATGVSQISGYLEGQLGRTPTIGEVYDFMEARATTTGKRTLNEGQISRAEAAVEGASKSRRQFQENEAMKRLLSGPLRPGRF